MRCEWYGNEHNWRLPPHMRESTCGTQRRRASIYPPCGILIEYRMYMYVCFTYVAITCVRSLRCCIGTVIFNISKSQIIRYAPYARICVFRAIAFYFYYIYLFDLLLPWHTMQQRRINSGTKCTRAQLNEVLRYRAPGSPIETFRGPIDAIRFAATRAHRNLSPALPYRHHGDCICIRSQMCIWYTHTY